MKARRCSDPRGRAAFWPSSTTARGVQSRPDSLATDAETKALAHERHQALEVKRGGDRRRLRRRGRRTLAARTTSPRLAAVRHKRGTAAVRP